LERAGQGAMPEGGAKPFGDLLKGLMRRKRFRQRAKYGRLAQAWEGVVGEQVAGRTRIAGFREGVLLVEVSSPVLLQELHGFLRPVLLEQLRRTEGGRDVASIEFRLGFCEGH